MSGISCVSGSASNSSVPVRRPAQREDVQEAARSRSPEDSVRISDEALALLRATENTRAGSDPAS